MPRSDTKTAMQDIDGCVRGNHVYKKLWEVTVGEELECKREPSNLMDRYAIAVDREGNIVRKQASMEKCPLLVLRLSAVVEVWIVQCKVNGAIQWIFLKEGWKYHAGSNQWSSTQGSEDVMSSNAVC